MSRIRVRPSIAGAAILISVSVLAACSAQSSSSPTATASPSLGFTPGTKDNPRVVVITADDTLKFSPASVTVAKGETVTFQVKNVGAVVHEFMIGPMEDAYADKEGTPEVADIAGGTSKSVTFTFDGPGPYAFACHAEGHFEAGMKGVITLVSA
jgi:uncharacterized cupredoxin-like copper-binding protein